MFLSKRFKTSQYNGNGLDKKLVSSLAKTRIPNLKQLKYLYKYLNKTEALVLSVSLLIAVIGLGFLAFHFYNNNLEIQPENGGKYIEGSLGSPKYVNPLYASLNEVDQDLSSLIYSSLFKRDIHGYLTPDLVESYQVSPDQKNYIFTIRQDAKWHNGQPVTVDDVIFTINSFKNSQYKSPLRYTFNGVEVSKLDDNTIQLVLKEAYAPFMEFLTFGIMPKDLWQDISPNSLPLAELNLKPIGSGPYQFKSLTKDKNGNIKAYTLEANEEYYNQVPYIKEVVFKFFVSPEEMLAALNNNKIDAASYLPAEYYPDIIAPNSFNFHQLAWPQMTGLFFNSSAGPVANVEVRRALAHVLDKTELIKTVLQERARELNGPILPNSFAYNEDSLAKYGYNQDKAKEILKGLGYTEQTTTEDTEQLPAGTWLMKNDAPLTLSLTVADDPSSLAVADFIASSWQTIGVKTDIRPMPAKEISSNLAPNHDFTVLLYSLLGSLDPDPYAFWHSSQKSGLNITGYSNKAVDKVLEEARINNNIEVRQKDYAEFQRLFSIDLPAIFLYSPDYIYIQNKRIKGLNTDGINSPKDRLSNINNWYSKENRTLNLSSEEAQ